MKISNETKVGTLAAVAIAVLILGFNFMKGRNVFSRDKYLYSEYVNIGGLTQSTPVMLNGLQVGQVDELTMIHENGNNVLVKFHIGHEYKIRKNTVARIVSSDLLGNKVLELDEMPAPLNLPALADSIDKIYKTNQAVGKMVLAKLENTEYTENKDTLVGGVEMSTLASLNQEVNPLKKKIESLVASIDTTVSGLNEVLNENTRKGLKQSFVSIKNTLNNIESSTKNLSMLVDNETPRIRGILDDIGSISKNLKDNNKTITRIINNFADISDTVRALNFTNTIHSVNETIQQADEMLAKINKGTGSVGKLMNDDTLYKNLEKSTNDLDALISDLKANPGKYLDVSLINFGKKK